MSQFFSYAIPGIPYGCVFGLLAIGIVLTYRTSGVFNLALGAQAYMSAVIFYVALRSGHWPLWLAFAVAVVLTGAVMGILLYRLIFIHIQTSPLLVKLVTTMGLLIAIPQIADIIFGTSTRLAPPSLWLNPNSVYWRVGFVAVNGTELSVAVLTLLVGTVLVLLFRYTSFGLYTKAIVESPRMVELSGIDANKVAGLSWILSSLLAGLAGVLLAPLFAQLSSLDFMSLLVSGIAAAALGGFVSLPLALAGGVGLGIAAQIIVGYLPSSSGLSSGLQTAFPFVVLVGLLLFLPSLRAGKKVSDPLSGCDPPPPQFVVKAKDEHVDQLMRTVSMIFFALWVFSSLTWVPYNWVFVFNQGLALSIVFLSITLLTGLGGEVSLCQGAFMGIGAFATGQLAMHFGVPVIVGMLIGGVVAATLGILVAIPTLRLGGIALALVTLALGLLADNLLFPLSWIGNGAGGLSVSRPRIGPISFSEDRLLFLFLLGVLGICTLIVSRIQKGTWGQYLIALRGNELAASAIGINVSASKVLIFAFASFMAGLGGALYAMVQSYVSSTDFAYQFSLLFLVVVAVVGIRRPQAAVQAGIGYIILQQLINTFPGRFNLLEPLLFGLVAVGYSLHPEGVVEHYKGAWANRLAVLREHKRTTPKNAPVEDGRLGSSGEQVCPY